MARTPKSKNKIKDLIINSDLSIITAIVTNLSVQDIQILSNEKLIIPEVVDNLTELNHALTTKVKVYQLVLDNLMSGLSLLEAFRVVGVKLNKSWELVQNYFLTARRYLMGYIFNIEDNKRNTKHFECLVLENIYKDYVLGFILSRDDSVREILLPELTERRRIIVSRLSNKTLACYDALVNLVKDGEFYGDALTMVATSLDATYNSLSNSIPTVRVRLLEDLENTLSRVKVHLPESTSQPEIEDIVSIPELMKLGVSDKILRLVEERDYYKAKASELQKEVIELTGKLNNKQ